MSQELLLNPFVPNPLKLDSVRGSVKSIAGMTLHVQIQRRAKLASVTKTELFQGHFGAHSNASESEPQRISLQRFEPNGPGTPLILAPQLIIGFASDFRHRSTGIISCNPMDLTDSVMH